MPCIYRRHTAGEIQSPLKCRPLERALPHPGPNEAQLLDFKCSQKHTIIRTSPVPCRIPHSPLMFIASLSTAIPRLIVLLQLVASRVFTLIGKKPTTRCPTGLSRTSLLARGSMTSRTSHLPTSDSQTPITTAAHIDMCSRKSDLWHSYPFLAKGRRVATRPQPQRNVKHERDNWRGACASPLDFRHV